MGDRRRFSESSRVEWARFWRREAAASRWRGHLLNVRSTALLVLSGCVVGDEGLVLLVCLTFVWFGGFLVGVKKALESSTSMPLLACGISER